MRVHSVRNRLTLRVLDGFGLANQGVRVLDGFGLANQGVRVLDGFGLANQGVRVLDAMAAIVGGTASRMSGGKFANGAITAAMAQAFNGERENRRARDNIGIKGAEC